MDPAVETMSDNRLHPRENISLDISEGDVEQSDTVELVDLPTETERVGTNLDTYLGPPECTSPTLPSNLNVEFPRSLLFAIDTLRDRFKGANVRAASQRLVERYLVERGSCSQINPDIVRDFRLRLFNVDSDRLESLLTSEESLNANVHDNIACAVDAIIYDGKMTGTFTPSERERIRNWFPIIKQIGDESVEGFALRTSFTPDTNLFVMKAPRNPKNDELVHEALIGFYAMNKLRHVLPNYMYVYGYVKCSPPAFDRREVVTWCSSTSPAVSYLITENIRDSVPIGEFLTDPSTTAPDVMAVFYESINALNLAYKIYGYTHFDLHYNNVLVRKYSTLVAVPFFGVSNTVVGYVVSRYVPYIIDYGYSRITVGGIGFGKIGLESVGIEGARAFPMYDVYKIIGFLGERLYTGRRTEHYAEIANILERLFSFFREGTLRARVTRRLTARRDWYGASESYRNITHDDYITWLQNKSGLINPVHTDTRRMVAAGVYPAPINTGLDTCRFYDLIASKQGPKNSLEYCEVVAALNDDIVLTPDIKQNAIAWLNSRFDADQYFTTTISDIEVSAQEVEMLRRRDDLGNGDTIPQITTGLLTPSFVTTYRNRILNLLRIKDIVAEVISYIKASVCSLASQGTYRLHADRIEALNSRSIEWTVFISRQRKILRQNLESMRSMNWGIVDSRVRSFWMQEHEPLILAV